MTVRRFWQLWVVILVLEVLLIFTTEPPPAPLLVRPRAVERFPALPSLPVKAEAGISDPMGPDALALQASPKWGAMVAATQANQPPPMLNWSLVGVFSRDGQARVLVRYEDDRLPIQELKVGASLPSGDVIGQIEAQRVCVLVGKQKKRRWLPINAVGSLVH